MAVPITEGVNQLKVGVRQWAWGQAEIIARRLNSNEGSTPTAIIEFRQEVADQIIEWLVQDPR